MSNVTHASLFLISILISPFVVSTEIKSSNLFGWDLSYGEVFSENDLAKNDTMLKYFNDAYHRKGKSKDMHLPKELFADIDIEAIKSAILIDYQVFWYMGHRSSTLYLDDGQSVMARTFDSKSNKVKYHTVDPDVYADFASVIRLRSQSTPVGGYTFKIPKGYSFAGYVGVISRYSSGDATQQLIAIEDLLNKQMEPGELGKLTNIMRRKMKPIYLEK